MPRKNNYVSPCPAGKGRGGREGAGRPFRAGYWPGALQKVLPCQGLGAVLVTVLVLLWGKAAPRGVER